MILDFQTELLFSSISPFELLLLAFGLFWLSDAVLGMYTYAGCYKNEIKCITFLEEKQANET